MYIRQAIPLEMVQSEIPRVNFLLCLVGPPCLVSVLHSDDWLRHGALVSAVAASQ